MEGSAAASTHDPKFPKCVFKSKKIFRPRNFSARSDGCTSAGKRADHAGKQRKLLETILRASQQRLKFNKNVRTAVIRAARMPAMPADDIKIVVRPRGGLDISKAEAACVAAAIMAAAVIEKADRAEDMACPNAQQNIMVLSTPSGERAEKYVRVHAINVPGKVYEVSAYGTTAHDTVKGVIRGIALEDIEAEIMQQIMTKHNPLAAGAKRIGSTTTVIVVFNGTKVPKYARYGSTLYPCGLYRKQIEVCKVCGKVGHRRDVCPTPNVRVCLACGVHNPREDHKCTPKCKLCGGEHPTGDRFSKGKYREAKLKFAECAQR